MLSVCQVNAPNSKNEDKINGPNIPLTLPAILGRGPLLKCSETKVSRRHASIDWDDDDGITIQALHSNPTLVMVSAVMSSLSKGESRTLHHGDIFGLLPNSAWYRICLADNKDSSSSVSNTECSTAKNSQEETISLTNGTLSTNKEEPAGQGSNESTAEEQTPNNALESSSKKKLLPVETDTAASTSRVPANNKQRKVVVSRKLDEPKMNLDINYSAPAAASDVCSTTDGLANKEVPAKADEKELVNTPNKKAKIEVIGTIQNVVQVAVNHRARALPSWMKNLDAAPSPAADDVGPAKRGRKRGTSRARAGRGAASSNRADIGQTDGEDTAPKTLPATTKRRGKKPLAHSPEGKVGGCESESTPTTSNNSPIEQPSSSNTTPAKGSSANTTPVKGSSADTTPAKGSSANTTPAKGSSANTTPAKGSSANTTPAKQSNGRRKLLHYMSDSESDDEAITAKATMAVRQAEHMKQRFPPTAKVTKEEQSSTSVASAGDVRGNDLGNKNDADTNSGSENGTAPSTSNARGGTVPGTGLTTAIATSTSAATATTASTATATAASTATAAVTGGVRRKSCPFGASCYRRNPQHKKDEAHPGDADYTSGPESDAAGSDDDDRPECEFGVDCYRKNPQHRLQYKHTRLPQPQRRAKRKARAARKRDADDSRDSDDSYDYDDPFMNDDSSDDYAPTDSDSESERLPSQPLDEEEKKDLKRMKKEAKKFVKGDQ